MRATATFLYDADGNGAKSTIAGAAVVYVGEDYEWRSGAGVSYYYFAGQRVAMRDSAGVTYLHADHLSSTTKTTGARSATPSVRERSAPSTVFTAGSSTLRPRMFL